MSAVSLIEGPLLLIAITVFVIGIVVRILGCLYAIIRSSIDKEVEWRYILSIVFRSVVPYYKAAGKKRLYASLRYVFHGCLIVAPLWVSGHIVLLSTSRIRWSWTHLPDLWADVMALLVVGLAIYFLLRCVIVGDVHSNPPKPQYGLIIVTALPFLTGFIAHHQWFDYGTILTLHMFSGEAMLVVSVFLFCRTRLNADKCTGCASCVLTCPTGTIEYRDEGKFRVFTYCTSQCIWCGACVAVCPEEAAELRHEIAVTQFFQVLKKGKIRSVELASCERCGCFFAPAPQVQRIERFVTTEKVKVPTLKYCEKCRRREIFDRMSFPKPMSGN